MLVYKSRKLDHGQCTQFVEILNGNITGQWLRANGNHSYTGDGNPELVGKPESTLKGYGFRKVSKTLHNSLMQEYRPN